MGVSKIGHRLAIKSIIDNLRGVSLDNSGRYDATNPVPLKFNYRRIMGGGGGPTQINSNFTLQFPS